MAIFKRSSIMTTRPQCLVASLIASLLLLSGCQPNDSLSAIAPSYAEAEAEIGAITKAQTIDMAAGSLEQAAANNDSCQNATIVAAFQAQQSDRQVQGCGTIITALADDNEGSRHQKILIELDGVSPKQTLLLVHNIDLAPRVAEVKRGTAVSFYGEYVYNNRGGLVHWTHHDPAARHQGGWIDSAGIRYQ
jgi:hypothetical protein